MRGAIRKARHFLPTRGFHFTRPLVLFQSDDWGLVGVRDHAGQAQLEAHGIRFGASPYDFYALETANDLHALFAVLQEHRDARGRSPLLTANFITANIDFAALAQTDFETLPLLSLARGLPAPWDRPGLFDAYREGVARGLLYPAFHGLTHFCQRVAERALREDSERGIFLRTLYAAATPQLMGRMPWLEFEYLDADAQEWLDVSAQHNAIATGVEFFQELFGEAPLSACAPGYRANEDTRRAWRANGIRVVQNGVGINLAPHWNAEQTLMLYRNVSFEPFLDAQTDVVGNALARAATAFERGQPAIVCMHSVNMHSTLSGARARTLAALDEFLTRLEKKYPDLFYVHDGDLLALVETGAFTHDQQRVECKPFSRWQPSPVVAQRLQADARGKAKNT